MILKKIKVSLIAISAFAVLSNSSAFSATTYAANASVTKNVSNSITSKSTKVINKSTIDLKKLQHNLNKLFNTRLTEDNIKGSNTNTAINKYGPILGSTDPNALLQLTEQVLKFPVCKQGNKSAAIGYIQYRLGVIVNRNFGPITVKKVETFQKLKGLTSNGIVDSATWVKLMN